jgi:hypothetical protein
MHVVHVQLCSVLQLNSPQSQSAVAVSTQVVVRRLPESTPPDWLVCIWQTPPHTANGAAAVQLAWTQRPAQLLCCSSASANRGTQAWAPACGVVRAQ